jgi:hypothetical protein
MAMSEGVLVESPNGEPVAEAIGGTVTVVLAILGLAHVVPNYLAPIATIVFGAVLLMRGVALFSEYAKVMPPTVQVSDGISAVFMAGAGGIVLGILALLGIEPMMLIAIAVIAYGGVLVLSANSSLHLRVPKTTKAQGHRGTEGHPDTVPMSEDISTGSGGFLAMAGLSAVVLGILALAGFSQEILVLVSLLAMGATMVLAGTALAGLMSMFLRGA